MNFTALLGSARTLTMGDAIALRTQVLQDLNDKGLTIVMVTHGPDVAQFARRAIVFKDGTIRKDEPVTGRPRAHDVLETLPPLEG